tara:strand:+ start:665 stop:1093 length:429 start_codon:yes stop_codon:yes gene_type:complete
MYLIINTQNNSKFKEPTRRSYRAYTYKTKAAATAGITRTKKYYQNAIDDVNKVLAEGKPYYHSRWSNQYEEATQDQTEYRSIDWRLVANGETLEVVAECDYEEPLITRTGRSPYNGNEITVTLPQSQVSTHMDPLCESHYTR